MKIEPYEMTD